MSGLLIRNYPTLATTFNSDDYSDIDGATGGTRKMLLSVMATRFGVQLAADGMVFGAGSAAAPLLAVGTSGNGIYASAANTLDLTTNGTRAITITSGQFVGIGVATPATAFHVGTSLTTSPRGIMSAQYSTGTDGARFHMRKARGTATAPTTVVTGDVLGKLVATGYDGSNYLEMASISLESTGTVAATRVPTRIVFSTATNAAPSVLTDRMWLSASGNLGVGTSSETGLTGSGGMIVSSTTLGTSGASGALIVGGTGAFGKKCFITDGSTGAQLRLEYTAASVYSDFGTLSTGHLDINNTAGSRITSTIVNNTAVSARSRQGGLAFDGVTAQNPLSFGTIVSWHPKTTPWSVAVTFMANDLNNGRTLFYYTYAGAMALRVALASSGYVAVAYYDLAASAYTVDKLVTTSVIEVGKVYTLVIAWDGSSTMTSFLNGVAQTLSGTPGLAVSASSAGYIGGYAASASFVWNGTIYSAQPFTRALSASEVVDLANKGVAEADKWANLSSIITGDSADFAGGTVGNWAAVTAGSLAVVSQALQLTNSTGGNGMQLSSVSMRPKAGKRYRLSFTHKLISGSAQQFTIRGSAGGSLFVVLGSNVLTFTPSGTVATFTTEFTNTGDDQYLYFNRVGNDAVYEFDNFSLVEIGCLLDADLGFGVGYQVPDRSTNNYHGVVSATGTSWTLAQRRGQLRVTSNTNGNQQLLGSQVCLPTNAIITSIIGYTTGTPTIKIGNVITGSQIVASVAMSASTYQSFTVAATTTTTGNLWVNSTTSDTINWTITYMIADT